MTLDEMQADVAAWQKATFVNTEQGLINHLAKEVLELAEAQTAEEAADVAILLMGYAALRGFSLADAIATKMQVNKSRKWGPPDADGVIEHVEVVAA